MNLRVSFEYPRHAHLSNVVASFLYDLSAEVRALADVTLVDEKPELVLVLYLEADDELGTRLRSRYRETHEHGERLSFLLLIPVDEIKGPAGRAAFLFATGKHIKQHAKVQITFVYFDGEPGSPEATASAMKYVRNRVHEMTGS